MPTNPTAFTALARGEFMDGKMAAEERVYPAEYSKFVTNFPSTVKIETHSFMSQLPRMTEFKGYTPSVRLTNKEYQVANKTFRAGQVTVSKENLDDDQLGGFLKLIKAIPKTGERDTGAKILEHLAAGTSGLCFDGSTFFANSHTVGTGDNLDTFNGAANDGSTHKIIALRTDNPFATPVIFQDRESLSELQTDEGTPQAEKLREYEYWADCRFGLGYGYWWDGYHVTITDLPTVPECYQLIEQILNGMRTFKLPKGRDSDAELYVHEGWVPAPANFVLLCDLPLGAVLERALKISQYVASTGNVDNVYQGIATVIPTSALNS